MYKVSASVIRDTTSNSDTADHTEGYHRSQSTRRRCQHARKKGRGCPKLIAVAEPTGAAPVTIHSRPSWWCWAAARDWRRAWASEMPCSLSTMDERLRAMAPSSPRGFQHSNRGGVRRSRAPHLLSSSRLLGSRRSLLHPVLLSESAPFLPLPSPPPRGNLVVHVSASSHADTVTGAGRPLCCCAPRGRLPSA